MNRLVAGAAALNQTPLDWSGNLRRARAAVSEARELGIGWLCLPELALTGYGCEDFFLAPEVGERALASLRELAPDCSGLVVAVGLPLWHEGSIYNTVAVIVDGTVEGFVAKQNLAGDGLHYEPRWFKAWPEGRVERIRLDDREVPLGDLVFDLGGVRLGFEICEDAWVADRPGTRLARRGVDLIFNPSASHFAFGKQRVRERFVLEGSRAFACGYVYANLLGNEAGRIIYDGGTVIACGGEYVAEGKRFSFRDHVVTAATIDLNRTRLQRARQVSHRPLVGEAEESTVRCGFLPSWRGPFTTPSSEASVAPASGWMTVRGIRRRRGCERGFVVSDHADFPGLLAAIEATRARRVLVTHGASESLARLLRERGIDAAPLATRFTGELPPDGPADEEEADRSDDVHAVAEEAS